MTSSPSNGASVDRRFLFISVFLVLATLAVYWQTRQFAFTVYDDPYYVYMNRSVTDGLTLEGVVWAFSTAYFDFWHPLVWLSHMLDCELFGLNAGMHHLVNVLLHTANSVLLFGLLRRMTGGTWRSGLVAALFALHPLHVESVAWVAERKDVLSTFFFLLSLLMYVRYARGAAAQGRGWSLFFFVLALMTKPMVVTLPFVLLLLDFWPLNRYSSLREPAFRKSAVEKIPFFALSALSCVVTYLGLQSGQNIHSIERVPWALRLANIPVSYGRYLVKTIWPTDLAVLYPLPAGWEPWRVIGACLILVFICLISFLAARRARYLLVGWLIFLGTLVPVIGIVSNGEQSIADRYMYIPSIGLFIAVVWTAAEISGRWPWRQWIQGLSSAAILVACAAIASLQVGHWRNDLTLWKQALVATRQNAVAEYNMGCALQLSEQTNAALQQYERTLQVKPDCSIAHVRIGQILLESHDVPGAVRHSSEAYRLAPSDPEACLILARARSAQGDSEEAMNHFQETVQLSPGYADAHYYLGLEYLKRCNFEEAVKSLIRTAYLDPGRADAHLYLGVAFSSQKDISPAIAQYRETLRLNPRSAAARNNLAWILATHPDPAYRDGAEAVRLAREACQLTGSQETIFVGTLAAAFAEAGEFENAVTASQAACEMASSLGQTNLLERNQQLLEQFRKREPHRE